MASTGDIAAWKALGGSVTGRGAARAFVAPTGEKFNSWAAASEFAETLKAAKPDPDAPTPMDAAPAPAPAKPRAKRATAAAKPAPKKAKAAPAAAAPPPSGTVGSGRAAAQGVSYVDAPALPRGGSDDLVELKGAARADSEAAALALLGAGGEPGGAYALFDVSALTPTGDRAHLHTAPAADPPLRVSGLIARSASDRATGFAVADVGPVTGFRAVLGGAAPAIVLTTAAATYVVHKPAAAYKKTYGHVLEMAELANDTRAALLDLGGPAADFAAVAAKLTRKRGAAVAAYGTAARALGACGHFVRDALAADDAAAGTAHATGAFAAALLDAVAKTRAELAGGGAAGVVIKDEAPAAAAPAVAADAKGKGKAAAGKGKGKAAAPVHVPLPALTPAQARDQADADLSVQLELKARVKEVAKAAGGGAAAAGAKAAAPKSGAYFQISESEIADDYPAPTLFTPPAGDQMDELLLADEDAVAAPPEALPTCLLTDFAVYDGEGFLKSLELVPLWSGVQPDVELYATGAVTQLPDGCDGYDEAAALAAAAAAGAGGSSSAAASTAPLVALSAIQEWHLEASADGRVDVVIRTDVAWYRLVTPAPAYAPFLAVVKTAGAVALKLWQLVAADGARAARVTFDAAVDALAALEPADPAFVSASKPAVARFLAVHGQVLLSQFKAIEQSAGARGLTKTALATALLARLAERRHTVLSRAPAAAKKAAPTKKLRSNPLKDRSTGRKAAPMTATATAMVRAVWRSYFKGPHGTGDADPAAAAAAAVADEEDDVNADDGEEDAAEDALAAAAAAPKNKAAPKKKKAAAASLVGAPVSTAGGVSLYASAALGGATIAPGDVVELAPWAGGPVDADGDAVPALGVVQALFTRASSAPAIQVRLAVRGADTVLGDAASDGELFVTTRAVTRPLADVADKLAAARRVREWSAAKRRDHLAEDLALAAANAAAADAGAPLTYFYRSFYEPERGMFRVLPADLALGTLIDEAGGAGAGVRAGPTAGTFIKDGVTIGVGDAVFLPPDAFDADAGGKKAPAPKKKKKRGDASSDDDDDDAEAAPAPQPAAAPKGSRSKFHKGGSNLGLRAWALGLVTGVAKGGASVTVTRFARPEDVSADLAYTADWWDVYATTETVTLPTAAVIRKAAIVKPGAGARGGDDVFVCRGTATALKRGAADGAVTAAVPPAVPATPPGGDTRPPPLPPRPADKSVGDGTSLATMDIFAGCGGLSEGLHIAGAAHSKWAIEYEPPAAEAYKLNNPSATVFADNCNVILAAAMKKAGCEGDCEVDAACAAEVDALIKTDRAKYDALPAPGDVEFLCGGPPCQGYSGMNRFNKGNWSVVQNSMVMAYLSFADFYRPRYFLLENVRNFVSHNKSFTFRLTLRSLLEMGYSVRFGVLNAGNFGVSQSRKRTFIIAAAPGETLPEWPTPVHVFRSPQLTINLPGGVAYTAVPQVAGAPVRTVTVRDAIGDLPPIGNGEGDDERPYAGPPQSAFQRGIRGDNAVLYDHISKTMNDLNLTRCRCIPKNQPGADWRVLKQVIADDEARGAAGQPRTYPNGKVVVAGREVGDLIPWCLPNTEDRHNGWRGLFGRLDPAGHFPTSTTDPQPMGKVGQVFHPAQDRIVSVRECARAQGFPDSFRLWGNVHQKHRQVGNAVPVPLAAAIGRQLRKALDATKAANEGQ